MRVTSLPLLLLLLLLQMLTKVAVDGAALPEGGGVDKFFGGRAESESLRELYQATTGSQWAVQTGWGRITGEEKGDACAGASVYGVECSSLLSTNDAMTDAVAVVEVIELPHNNLQGFVVIADLLSRFRSLRILNLDGNPLLCGVFGAVPAVNPVLTVLSISSCRFSHDVPASIVKLRSLDTLMLDGNAFDSVPAIFVANNNNNNNNSAVTASFPLLRQWNVSGNLFNSVHSDSPEHVCKQYSRHAGASSTSGYLADDASKNSDEKIWKVFDALFGLFVSIMCIAAIFVPHRSSSAEDEDGAV